MEVFMKITIVQNITKIFDMERNLLSSRLNETYLLEPDEGKIIRHKESGQVYKTGICVNKERKFAEYEELDDPKASN